MSQRLKKPTVKDILDLYTDCEKRYQESGIFDLFDQDEQYYELDFASLLGIPKEFAAQGIILPTARDMVDTCVDFTNITNLRLKVPYKSDKEGDKKRAELLKKFGYGVMWRNNVEATIAPLRVGAKYYWLNGLTIFKDVWDADRGLDKPERNEDESENAYASRVDEWRSNTHDSIPIVIQSIHPSNIMLDPYYNGGMFVFETREELIYNVKDKWPKFKNHNGRNITERVKHVSFWDKNYRCELIDDEPVLKIDVAKHSYGFIPYVPVDSGLGNISKDNDLSKRYVGILRYMTDLLRSESRDYSLADILLAREVLTGGFIEGDRAGEVTEVSVKYGEYTKLPPGVTVRPYESKLPPQELQQHLGISSDYISAHAAPRSTRGLSEEGVRSGSDRRLIQSQAAMRYAYSNEAFKYGVSKVLSNCARILMNVVPGDIRVWAETPNDEFDEEISRDDLREPFNFYVDFKATSPEEDYRTHDDLERLVQSQIYTKRKAREELPNIDPDELERQEQEQMIVMSQPFQTVLQNLAASKLMQVAQGLQMAASPPPAGQPGTQGGMVPPVQPPVMPGGPQQMQNQMRNQRSQVPMNPNQGQGGGGNRVA